MAGDHAFAAAWPERAIVQEPLARLPWYHHVALVDHFQRFLLEVGTGFAFVGRQVPIEVGDQDYVLDPLLCREKHRVVVEHTPGDLKKPIGVTGCETKIVAKLPKEFQGSLPTVEEIEAELSGKPRRKAKESRRKP